MEWQHRREFTIVGHRCGRHLVFIVLLATCATTAVAQPSRVNPDFDSYLKQVAWSDIAPSPTLRLQGGDDPRDLQAGDDSRESCLDWLLPRSHLPLPFLRGLAEGSGATLPLPIGTSFVSTELNRSVGVDNLRVGIGGNPPQPVDRFSAGDLSAHASSQIFRLDGWLFPFLNMYGVVGRTKSTGPLQQACAAIMAAIMAAIVRRDPAELRQVWRLVATAAACWWAGDGSLAWLVWAT